MWLLLSRRLRTWLLLAIGLPLVTRLVTALAERAERRAPGATTTRALQRSASGLQRVRARRRRRGRSGG